MTLPTLPIPLSSTPAGIGATRRALYNILLHTALAALWPLLLPAMLALPRRRATLLQRLTPVSPLRHPLPPRCGPHLRPIWIHALSVGEVISALPLVKALKSLDPHRPLVFSASTLSGLDTARRLLAAPLVQALLPFPYDLHLFVKRALQAIDPALVLIVESDVWPEFLMALQQRATPALLVNARLSQRSLRRFRRVRFLARPMFGMFRAIGVQSVEDQARFRQLGVPLERLRVTGNLKFDTPAPARLDPEAAPLREMLARAPALRVLLAGSTHPGEETILLTAFAALRRRYPHLLLVIAPRHPQRAAAVCREARSAGLPAMSLTTLSQDSLWQASLPAVIVIDRLGLLTGLYALATIALVGGSLLPIRGIGGHNPLEAAALARPILFGPHMDNFRAIARLLLEAGGAFEVSGASRLQAVVARLLDNPQTAARAGRAARDLFRANQGALARTVCLVQDALGSPRP